jgi:hypothetical protein
LSRNIVPTLLRLALLAVLLAVFALRLPAELLVRLEPVSAPAPDFGSLPVIVAYDERIFTLFAARNAAGFDHEYEGIAMASPRQKVREELAGKDFPSLKRLRLIFDRLSDYHLVVWVLQRGNGPEFARAEPGWWVTTRAADFAGLADALKDFYIEADIPSLRQKVGAEYRGEIERWQPLMDTSLRNIQEYLGISEFPFRQLVIIPNLLDSYYDGYGPQIGETAYVVAGPTETERSLTGLIEHEALHSIIGPMIDRNINVVSQAQADRLYDVLEKSMPSSYGSWASVLEETLIRAINLRMVKDEPLRTRMITQFEDQGFLLIRPLNGALVDYERSGDSFERFMPKLLGTLNAVQLSSPK